MAALTEALNLDCFIISCDNYASYLKSGLVDVEWLDSHRIPCIWKKRFDALDKTSNHIILSLPLGFENEFEIVDRIRIDVQGNI